MTVRLVPLHDADSGDGRVAGSIEDRLTLVAELSRTMWALTRLPLPGYTRRTIPFRLIPLADQ